jgi:hypothetical protein
MYEYYGLCILTIYQAHGDISVNGVVKVAGIQNVFPPMLGFSSLRFL